MSRPEAYTVRTHGLSVSNQFCMPFFIRAAMLAEPDKYGLEDDEELDGILKLPLDEFTKRVYDGTLPDCFFDEENMEFFENATDNHGIARFVEFSGEFVLDLDMMPVALAITDRMTKNICRLVENNGVAEEYDYDTAFIIPLDKQPSLYATGYGGFDDVVKELSEKVKSAGVELPEKFPWYAVVGCLDGIIYDT